MLDLFATTPARIDRDTAAGSGGAGFYFKSVNWMLGARPIFIGLDIEVPPGQFLAVIGKKAAGKSTFLRLLAGLETPDGGHIARGPGGSAAGGTRLMFPEPRLLPWAPVVENVALGLGAQARGSEALARAAALLADMGLGDRADDLPATLSKMQQQQVALARALVGAPKILALDAPFRGLDPASRSSMQQLLARIWAERGFTTVLAAQDPADALLMADRVVVLKAGRVRLDLEIDQPRPRDPHHPALAALERHIRNLL